MVGGGYTVDVCHACLRSQLLKLLLISYFTCFVPDIIVTSHSNITYTLNNTAITSELSSVTTSASADRYYKILQSKRRCKGYVISDQYLARQFIMLVIIYFFRSGFT